MTFLEYLFGIGSGVVAAGGIFHFAASGWLSRHLQVHKADLERDMVNHKHDLSGFADRNRLLLKREEMMFERELAATASFLEIMDSVLPKSGAYQEWEYAQDHIADRLHIHQQKLQNFYAKHSVAIGSKARDFISTAIEEAMGGAIMVGEETASEPYGFHSQPSYEVCAYVDDFYKAMQQAENQLRYDLKHGSFAA
jgi:hypothetical protein